MNWEKRVIIVAWQTFIVINSCHANDLVPIVVKTIHGHNVRCWSFFSHRWVRRRNRDESFRLMIFLVSFVAHVRRGPAHFKHQNWLLEHRWMDFFLINVLYYIFITRMYRCKEWMITFMHVCVLYNENRSKPLLWLFKVRPNSVKILNKTPPFLIAHCKAIGGPAKNWTSLHAYRKHIDLNSIQTIAKHHCF